MAWLFTLLSLALSLGYSRVTCKLPSTWMTDWTYFFLSLFFRQTSRVEVHGKNLAQSLLTLTTWLWSTWQTGTVSEETDSNWSSPPSKTLVSMPNVLVWGRDAFGPTWTSSQSLQVKLAKRAKAWVISCTRPSIGAFYYFSWCTLLFLFFFFFFFSFSISLAHSPCLCSLLFFSSPSSTCTGTCTRRSSPPTLDYSWFFPLCTLAG